MSDLKDMMVFTGNANPELAKDICDYFHTPLNIAEVKTFSDGEIFVEIAENVRGRDVFIVQPTCTPVNDNLMELLLMADALRRSSARRITAVMPYYGYARQIARLRPECRYQRKLLRKC
jgi:ribose-phosphate pyrophosphokinase